MAGVFSHLHPRPITRIMKPRITLAESPLPEGGDLLLQEHDGRMSLVIQGQQICGPATRAVEEEMARLACAPFRPARQPKLWIAGLGLGHSLAAVATELKQKRATFVIAEPLAALADWHRLHLPDSPLHTESRVVFENACDASTLARHQGSLHAVLIHLDAAPTGAGNRPLAADPRWLSAAYEALQAGGLLAIAASRNVPGLRRRLLRAGFEVAEHLAPVSPNAKKTRLAPIWLARKRRGDS
jgi:spermidine synthase